MKKLLFFIVSVLSLAIIFGAGWSAAGSTSQPAPVYSSKTAEENGNEEPEKDECPDGKCPECPHRDYHRYGFRFRTPKPRGGNGVPLIPQKAI